MRVSNPARGSMCHTFLYVAAGLIGLSCGRCGAELVVTLINFFAKSNVIEEDSYSTEAWMTAAAVGLGSILFAYFYMEHRHMHQSEKMANRLRAIASGNLLIKTGVRVDCIRLNQLNANDQALMEQAVSCSALWEAVSGAHSLKADTLSIARQFDRDVQHFCTTLTSDYPEQALVGYLHQRLVQLHEQLLGLSNHLLVEAAIELPSSRGCCRRRQSAPLLFPAAQPVVVAGGRGAGASVSAVRLLP